MQDLDQFVERRLVVASPTVQSLGRQAVDAVTQSLAGLGWRLYGAGHLERRDAAPVHVLAAGESVVQTLVRREG